MVTRKARSLDESPPKPEKKSSGRKPVQDDASKFLAQLRALDMKKHKIGEDESFGFFGKDGYDTPITEFISTGCLAIDKHIGGTQGGWPISRLSECASWESVGKSTLCDQSIAQAQRMGGIVALIDSERSRDARYTTKLGANVDQIISKKADCLEEVFDATDSILDIQEKIVGEAQRANRQAPPLLILWDSLGGTPAKAEMDGAADDRHVGVHARVIKMNFRRITQRLAALRAAFVFTNHFYQEIGPYGSLKTSGGSGIRYFASVRLWLFKKEEIKIGSQVIGHVVEAKTKKTRVHTPRMPTQAALLYGMGFDNSYTLFEWGKKHGIAVGHVWIIERGAWCWLMLPDGSHKAFQGGFLALGELFKERPDVYEQFAASYLREGEGIIDTTAEEEKPSEDEKEDE